jgi:large subunit ribosomal protein L24e
VQDSTFEFEKRRNRPVKYNRELMSKTLQAMKRVAEIKSKREERFFERRMRVAKVQQKQQLRQEIKTGIELIAPAAADREKAIHNATRRVAQRLRPSEETKMQN